MQQNVSQYPKNDIWRLYEIRARIYTLLQRPNENTNLLNNEYVNEEQEIIDKLYERTKQSSTLPYEPLLLLRSLPLLLAHIGLSVCLMYKMVLEFAALTQQLYPQILVYTVFAFFISCFN
ncbi:unnamed protein product [Rotaria sp. Silwood1]|nr:unnamed protein product [Rotaria sp. Silwood1]CAF1679495.1 unnamed protein product [Rotaria sp. Silwood1]